MAIGVNAISVGFVSIIVRRYEMTIDLDALAGVKLIIELILGLGGIGGIIFGAVRWVDKQNKQDKDIQHLKKEMSLLVMGIDACLDGLEQQGCNHTVPKTRKMIQNYLNEQAHDLDDKE